MPRPRLNIWLKYALLYDKTPKDISIACNISLQTAYKILRGRTLNKLDIAKRLAEYLKIPYSKFDRYWNTRKRRKPCR